VLIACGGLVGGYFFIGAGKSKPAAKNNGKAKAGNTTTAKVRAARTEPVVEAAMVRVAATDKLTLHIGKQSVTETWGNLGLSAKDGLDEQKLEAALLELKKGYDQSPRDARMDLETPKMIKERDGHAIDLYGAANAIEMAAYAGRNTVDVPMVTLPPAVTVKDLGIDDISHVLSTFTTRFSIVETSRNYNLKLAASKLNGYVLKPHEEFSFNNVVGARSYENGYKIAHVITSGEMVDGLAGGTCQISTTLHGAAFFAGLEILKSKPHSRPSTYVEMGLDATVVYGYTDMHLRNPYDFPVVIHYRVARGESTVRILGKRRPYDRIEFYREILKELPFDTVTRESDDMPIGSMVINQRGFPGYKVRRYRKYYRHHKLVKTDKWTLRYNPVTEYVVTGTNPDPNLPPPKQKRHHGPRPPKKTEKHIYQ